MELHGDFVADGNVCSVAHCCAAGICDNRVAALEQTQRTALVELQHQARDALALRIEVALHAHAQIAFALCESQTQRGDSPAKVEGGDVRVRHGEALTRGLQS